MTKNNLILSLVLLILTVNILAQEKEISFSELEPVAVANTNNLEEAAPFLNPYGSRLYFIRTNKPLTEGDEERVLHEIWYIDKNNDEWGEPQKAPSPLNTPGQNSAVIGFDRDMGVYLFGLYTEYNQTKIGASFSMPSGRRWSRPERLDIPDIDLSMGFYGLYMHPNQDVMLISKGDSGFEDLYVTVKTADGKWSQPISLGENINTDAFEISPFLTYDQKYLFFSRGGEGMNTDIFMAERLDDTWDNWSVPERLPAPINSDKFDAYFSMSRDSVVVFSSNRQGTNDLFFSKMTMQKQDTSDTLLPDDITIPIQEITQPLPIVSNDTGAPTENQKENSISGEEKLNTESLSENFDLHKLNIPNEADSYVFFEFNKSSLTQKFKEKLDKIVEELKANPSTQIEVAGHTDYIDREEFNMKLSNRRALEVAQYLISKGISKDRIMPVGYGESLPISNNEKEYGRMLNRRVELRLITTN